MDYRLDTIAIAVSQHYRLLRGILTEEGSPRMLTDEEAKTADYLADVIRSVGGRGLYEYCTDRFQNAWLKRDLRGYKIKFVILRLRDILPEGTAKNELNSRIDALIDMAERLAGCVSDDKRRNRAAVEARKEASLAKKAEKEAVKRNIPRQMGLFSLDIEDKKKEEVSDDIQDDVFDDIDMIYMPSDPSWRRKTTSASESEKQEDSLKEPAKGRRKGKKKESRFDRMAKEIIESEYNIRHEDDTEVYNEDDETTEDHEECNDDSEKEDFRRDYYSEYYEEN